MVSLYLVDLKILRLILLANITISVAISTLLRSESFMKRFMIMSSTFTHVYDKTTIFLINVIVFLSYSQGFSVLIGNFYFKFN